MHDFHLLWPGGAPHAAGGHAADQPALTVHLPPAERATGCGVVVAPGGAYMLLASDHEGLQVAHWLNAHGIAAFVLRYRVRPTYGSEVSLLDAQRAIRFVRHHAQRFGVSPRRVGMLGFSAGGHLTTAAGTRWRDATGTAGDAIDREDARPDFMAPIYAAIDEALFDPAVVGKLAEGAFPPTHVHVDAQTPTAFLVHTHEDRGVVPLHSLHFYRALLEAGVPAEMHVFGFGPHGVGLAPGDPDLNEWTRLFPRWLRRSGFLTDAARMPVRGRVSIDGEPVLMGWVTFVPDDADAPLACAYLAAQRPGRVMLDAVHGAVPGRHRVEIHRVGQRFPLDASGTYSQAGAERFVTYAPGDTAPIHVDIAEGVAFTIDVRTR